jgi:hypothetical protein
MLKLVCSSVKKILFLNQRRLPSMLDPEEDENVPGS